MNDLERAYAALAQDADTVRLTTSDALRGRADRRARIRLATGCAVLAVVVGATAVGAQWVLRSSHGTPPGPSTSQSPSAEPPSPTPATSAPSSPAPTSPSHTKPAPTTIPDSAFLQLADTNGEERPAPAPSDNMLPSLCGAKYVSDSSIQARRTMHITYWKGRHPVGTVPDGTCDETMLIEMRYPTVDVEGRPTGGDDVRLISVVRIDGVVMVLYEQGWEAGWSAEGPVVDSFTRTAVSRLRAWLG